MGVRKKVLYRYHDEKEFIETPYTENSEEDAVRIVLAHVSESDSRTGAYCGNDERKSREWNCRRYCVIIVDKWKQRQ